jgi:hypothetical protein
MAPEQLKSSRTADVRVDVWALGVVLYELTTGKRLFDVESSVEFIAHVLMDPHVPLRVRVPELPAALEAVVDRCLEKDLTRRYADVAELARALAPLTGEAGCALIARIEKVSEARVPPTLRDEATDLESPARGTAAAIASRTKSTAALPRGEKAATAGPGQASRGIVIAALALAAVGATFAIAVWKRSQPERATADPGRGTAPPPAPSGSPAESVGLDAAIAAVAAVPEAGVLPGSDARPAAASPSSRVATAGSGRPQGRPVVFQEESDALIERCQISDRIARLINPNVGGQRERVCVEFGALGCVEIKRRCAVAMSKEEAAACRDFVALLESSRPKICRTSGTSRDELDNDPDKAFTYALRRATEWCGDALKHKVKFIGKVATSKVIETGCSNVAAALASTCNAATDQGKDLVASLGKVRVIVCDHADGAATAKVVGDTLHVWTNIVMNDPELRVQCAIMSALGLDRLASCGDPR